MTLPAQAVVIEGEILGLFIFKDAPYLILAKPSGLGQDAGDEDIEEAVPISLQAGVEVPKRTMQTGREFQRHTGSAAKGDAQGNLLR